MVRKETDICPKCGGRLQSRGMIRRIIRLGEGEKIFIRVSRLSCSECGSWHVVLPDILLPYKHYTKEVVEHKVDWDSDKYIDYPCDSTKKKWSQK